MSVYFFKYKECMKNLILLLASILMCLPFISLPLMGQTAARTEVQTVKPFEETRPGKSAARESGKIQWIIKGSGGWGEESVP
jgi:hypothetical protein